MFTKTLRYKGKEPKNLGRWGMLYPGSIIVLTEHELSGLEKDGDMKEWEGVPASAKAVRPKRPVQGETESDRDFKARTEEWRSQIVSHERLEAEREPARTFVAWAGMASYDQLKGEIGRLRKLGAPVPERLEERGSLQIRASLTAMVRNWAGAEKVFSQEVAA